MTPPPGPHPHPSAWQVPLKYRMTLLQKGAARRERRGEIDFINADSGMPLSEAEEGVLGYSHARIRVYFKPRDVGQVRRGGGGSCWVDVRFRPCGGRRGGSGLPQPASRP
eukprot:7195317-Prymnesium_polylepis.1